jgi:hypothetical protein
LNKNLLIDLSKSRHLIFHLKTAAAIRERDFIFTLSLSISLTDRIVRSPFIALVITKVLTTKVLINFYANFAIISPTTIFVSTVCVWVGMFELIIATIPFAPLCLTHQMQ